MKKQLMSQMETITDFYRNKIGQVPAGLHDGAGHFNVFKLEPYIGKSARPVPYSRRDYFKVMLVRGSGNIHYADKVIPVHKQALTFSNPQIPYKWDTTEHISSGVFCVFNHAFFLNYGNILQYNVFQPGAAARAEVDVGNPDGAILALGPEGARFRQVQPVRDAAGGAGIAFDERVFVKPHGHSPCGVASCA